MNSALPLHLIPVPGARPWKTHGLDRELAAVPPGTVPAITTHEDAQPSYGLVAFLKATGLLWARSSDDSGDLENAFAARAGTTAPLSSGSIAVSGSVLHEASHTTHIGAYTAGMLEPFQVRPIRTGRTEPLSQNWDINAMTAWFQAHMPWSALVFSGTDMTGLLTAVRTESGVVESFDALITTGHAVTDGVCTSAINRAVALNSVDFRFELHFGANASGVRSGADTFRAPLAAVLGPDLVNASNVSPPEVAGVDLDWLGLQPVQHLAVRFPLVSGWDGGRAQAMHQHVIQVMTSQQERD